MKKNEHSINIPLKVAWGGGFEGVDDQFGQKKCIDFGEFSFSFVGGFEIFQSCVMPSGDGTEYF